MRHRRTQAGPRRARHLVLICPLAFRHARLARRDGGPAGLLSERHELHGPRDHLSLGQPDDHDRPRVHGRGAVLGRGHPLPGAGRRWTAYVEVARDRDRPTTARRQVRCRCAAGVGRVGRDDESRIEGYRRFCNKLWNATRLVLGNLDDRPVAEMPEPEALELIEDRWIASRVASAQREVTDGIEGFAFQDSINAAYGCAWNEFCDWWLEAAKERLRAKDATAQAIAIFCLDNLMRLLHPFMPFLTDELWSRLPGKRDFAMRAQWPDELHSYVDGEAEVEFERLMETVNEIRSYRKTMAGVPATGGAVQLTAAADPDWQRALSLLAQVAVVDELPPGRALGLSEGSVVFPTVAAADPAVIAKKRADLQKELDRVLAKLANPDFRAKAPEAVIAEQEARAQELKAAIDRLL